MTGLVGGRECHRVGAGRKVAGLPLPCGAVGTEWAEAEFSSAESGAARRVLAEAAEAAPGLIALANARGGRDNVTVGVVRVLSPAADPGRTTGITRTLASFP